MHKLKFVKLLALVFVAFSLIFVTSCGKKDDKGPSAQEELIDLLHGNTFTATAASSLENVEGVTVSEVSISFSGDASMTFTLTGGDINTHAATGGSFAIAEDGTLSGLTVDPATDRSATATSINYDSGAGTITIVFSTEESTARISGVGKFTLVFSVG